MTYKKTIFWFRNDLRLKDNPGLYQAFQDTETVLPVYILDDETPNTKEYGDKRLGAASRWWLHHSLLDLDKSLKRHHLSLNLQ